MIQFSYEEFIRPYVSQATQWRLKFSMWPRRCSISGKRIWLEDAYRGIRTITGPGTPVIEHYWVRCDEFIIWNLKGRK
jgi:hypothetical protein